MATAKRATRAKTKTKAPTPPKEGLKKKPAETPFVTKVLDHAHNWMWLLDQLYEFKKEFESISKADYGAEAGAAMDLVSFATGILVSERMMESPRERKQLWAAHAAINATGRKKPEHVDIVVMATSIRRSLFQGVQKQPIGQWSVEEAGQMLRDLRGRWFSTLKHPINDEPAIRQHFAAVLQYSDASVAQVVWHLAMVFGALNAKRSTVFKADKNGEFDLHSAREQNATLLETIRKTLTKVGIWNEFKKGPTADEHSITPEEQKASLAEFMKRPEEERDPRVRHQRRRRR